MSGKLFVVATPIGNLGDISTRAIACLRDADLILAEDTRHSARLLQHLGVATPMRSLHEHNEIEQTAVVIERLQQGQQLALISDAGTPLISDPGFVLVRECRRLGLNVVPIPGPSSIIAALSVAGLATDQFHYHGFLPARSGERQKALQQLLTQPGTHVLLESTHRLMASLQDLLQIGGEHFELVLCKELTKAHEAVWRANVGDLLPRLQQQPELQKGEFVMLFETPPQQESIADQAALLRLLLAEMPLKKAVALAVKISGAHRNQLYQLALELKSENP